MNGNAFALGRGQLVCSLRSVAREWRWSEARVRRFFRRLQGDALIDAETTHSATQITIRNYDKYQAGRTPTDAETTHSATHPYKSIKEPKETKKTYTPEFERFWVVYPKRKTDSKRDTSKKFTIALREVDADTLIGAAEQYREHLESTNKTQYAKGASVWLNGAMWERFTSSDEPSTPRLTPEERWPVVKSLLASKDVLNTRTFRDLIEPQVPVSYEPLTLRGPALSEELQAKVRFRWGAEVVFVSEAHPLDIPDELRVSA